jgi:hypothetical protein
MANQYIFKRVEKKYKLTEETYHAFIDAVKDKIHVDEYGLHTIHNIYYDTPDYELIRTSIEKPKYKEKFRVRSYGDWSEGKPIFLEIKKKYKGTVYKRRITLSGEEAKEFLQNETLPEKDDQILREIRYFLDFYKPVPMTYLAYERMAYVGNEDSELRLTIDHNIRGRFHNMDITCDEDCKIIDPNMYLMEIKVPTAYPMWLVQILCDLKIYPASFSKYGTIYSDCVRNNELQRREDLCLQVF